MSRSTTPQRHSSEEVLNWFQDQVKQSRQNVSIHHHLIKEEGDYLYLPVHVPNKDAFEVARFLQEIEDKWNDQEEPEHLPHLLLIPTKD